MSIHQKINMKGNAVNIPPHFFKDRERHGESIGYERAKARRVMERRYTQLYYNSSRIEYRQDCKTNYREPGEPDYDAPTLQERSWEMARIQRELK